MITALKSAFARHGIPKTVVSDNGPQFSSEEFAAFANAYLFTHVTSSPRFPASNGQAERVKNVHSLPCYRIVPPPSRGVESHLRSSLWAGVSGTLYLKQKTDSFLNGPTSHSFEWTMEDSKSNRKETMTNATEPGTYLRYQMCG